MKFFLDTTNIQEIEEFASTGLVDGITTNPSLVAKSGGSLTSILADICSIISGPVSAEVIATDFKGMMDEALKLKKIAKNITIKVPLTVDGLKACYALSQQGIMVNVTLCFSATQALLAAKAGATFVSPFIGRLDDIGYDGINLIDDIVQTFNNYPDLQTEVLAASIRTPLHVAQSAQAGADVATIPPKIFRDLFKNPLTDRGIDIFLSDWKNANARL